MPDQDFAAAVQAVAQALSRWDNPNVNQLEPQEKSKFDIGVTVEGEDDTQFRGRADAAALWHRGHDSNLGVPMQGTPMGQTLNLLERVRTMSQCPSPLKGVQKNVMEFWDTRCKQAVDSGDHGTVMSYWLASQILRDVAELPLGDRGIALTAMQQASDEDLWGLRQELRDSLGNQREFANVAIELLRRSGLFPDLSDEGEDEQETTGEHPDQGEPQEAESEEQQGEDEESSESIEQLTPEDSDEMIDVELDEDEFSEAQSSQHEQIAQVANREYRVFTKEFDMVVRPRDVATHDELSEYYLQLNKELKRHQGTSGKLARRLRAQLMARQKRHWQFDAEEGALDPSRLSRLITDPTHHLVYRNEIELEERDTTVTLLIDSSGSMRGRAMMLATICAYLVAETLEVCGITVEVLGFTTANWKGGRSAQAWAEAGSPQAPGRLNDLCHIVLKNASDSWNIAKRGFGVLLKGSLLKENIDGEALLWAHKRLLDIPCDRRILLVISDGAPVDERTMGVNGANLLDLHLSMVTQTIQEKSPVELVALGIGHDVSRYYDHSASVMSAESLADVLIGELANLFDTSKRKRSRSRAGI